MRKKLITTHLLKFIYHVSKTPTYKRKIVVTRSCGLMDDIEFKKCNDIINECKK